MCSKLFNRAGPNSYSMKILAQGLMLAAAPFLHVDYSSATPSGPPTYSNAEIGIIIAVGTFILVSAAFLLTWLIYVMKKKRKGSK